MGQGGDKIVWSPSRYLWGGGADWIQISKELGLIHVFDRLSLLRMEENRTEILNLINS